MRLGYTSRVGCRLERHLSSRASFFSGIHVYPCIRDISVYLHPACEVQRSMSLERRWSAGET